MQVSIKGLLAPLAVAVLLSPSMAAAVEWRVPVTDQVQIVAGGISEAELGGNYTASGNVSGNAVSANFTVAGGNAFTITINAGGQTHGPLQGTWRFANGTLTGRVTAPGQGTIVLTVSLSGVSAAQLRSGASVQVQISALGDQPQTFNVRKTS